MLVYSRSRKEWIFRNDSWAVLILPCNRHLFARNNDSNRCCRPGKAWVYRSRIIDRVQLPGIDQPIHKPSFFKTQDSVCDKMHACCLVTRLADTTNMQISWERNTQILIVTPSATWMLEQDQARNVHSSGSGFGKSRGTYVLTHIACSQVCLSHFLHKGFADLVLRCTTALSDLPGTENKKPGSRHGTSRIKSANDNVNKTQKNLSPSTKLTSPTTFQCLLLVSAQSRFPHARMVSVLARPNFWRIVIRTTKFLVFAKALQRSTKIALRKGNQRSQPHRFFQFCEGTAGTVIDTCILIVPYVLHIAMADMIKSQWLSVDLTAWELIRNFYVILQY